MWDGRNSRKCLWSTVGMRLMFNRSAIAIMTQSTKSMRESVYFSMMSVARTISDSLAKTSVNSPSNTALIKRTKAAYPASRIVIYANSVNKQQTLQSQTHHCQINIGGESKPLPPLLEWVQFLSLLHCTKTFSKSLERENHEYLEIAKAFAGADRKEYEKIILTKEFCEEALAAIEKFLLALDFVARQLGTSGEPTKTTYLQ